MHHSSPQVSSLPEFLQPSGPGNNLLAGLQSFSGNLHNGGLIGALISGANGLATGQRNDPQGQQQEVLRAQYKALIPILGEQRAALAVLNPEMGKALLQQGDGRQAISIHDGTGWHGHSDGCARWHCGAGLSGRAQAELWRDRGIGRAENLRLDRSEQAQHHGSFPEWSRAMTQ